MLLYKVEQEAIVKKQLKYKGRPQEDKHFNKVCSYRILLASTCHPWL